MTVSRYSEPKIVLDGFPYGVNELSDPTHLRPGELAGVKNMVLRDGRTLESRLGQTGEHDRSYRPLAYGCKLLHRYMSLANDKRLLLVSRGKMYADTDDNRLFDEVVSITGTPATQQFYDSVLFCSDEYELAAWEPGVGVERPNLNVFIGNQNFIKAWTQGEYDPAWTPGEGGGYLPYSKFEYYMTFDVSIGDTFLGETGPVETTIARAGSSATTYADAFWYSRVDLSIYAAFYAVSVGIDTAGSGHAVNDKVTVTGGTILNVTSIDGGGGVTGVEIYDAVLNSSEPTNPVSQTATTGSGINAKFDLAFSSMSDNKVLFLRPNDYWLSRIPPYVSAINFYRTPPLDSFSDYPYDGNAYSAFWVGSVSMDSIRATTYDPLLGPVIFEDDGSIFQKQMRKPPLTSPPRSKHMTLHKGRLWMTSPSIKGNNETEWTYYPDLIAFSAFEANGTEPMVFFPESTFPVGAGEPDEITGIRSWRNQVLLAWKANKMYAVLGGDDELDFGIPNISVQLIDPNVGCIAPNTICEVDGGIAWLSNRGPYIYDGTAPRPLAAHKVKKSFERIPNNRRTSACAVYNSKEREYTIFYTDPNGTTSAYNRHYMTYNFGTATWTMGVLERGVNVALEVRDADVQSYTLWGLEDNTGTMLASTPLVQRAESGFLEGFVTPAYGDSQKIDFSADLGFLDGGAPFMDKKFKEIIVEASSQVPLTLDILIDNKYDSRAAGTSLTLDPPVSDDTLIWGEGNWGEKNWGSSLQGSTSIALTRNLDTLPVGKSIRPIISGINIYDPVKIHSITIYYEPKEGTR
ncbi:MAG: hypothetical protein OEV86_12965 [Candidatus Krumholzibacteria bacterium]|nr:hypothetical protein [Candidatus Krumholzibacteria bacterium]